MANPEDDTSETVSRYIQELLDRRTDPAPSDLSSDSPVSETELIRRVGTEEFRKEMVSRFERLRQLAKEAAPPPPEVNQRRRRPRLGWIWLIFAIVTSPVLCSWAWNALDAAPEESSPERVDADRAGERRQPRLAGRAVPNRAASSVVIQRPESTLAATTRDSDAWDTPLESAAHLVRQGGNATAMLLGLSDQVTTEMRQRARSRIERMLSDAVNDRILGYSAAVSVARIEVQPDPTGRRLALDYVGDVLDAAGHVIGRVLGTYTLSPESLSASVLYEGEDRVEYSTNYFKSKF